MKTSALPFSIGDRAPMILGAAASGRFFSLDAQVGRPVVVVSVGALEVEAAAAVLDFIQKSTPAFQATGVDVAILAPATLAFTTRFAAAPEARDALLYVTEDPAVAMAEVDGAAAAILIDRNTRVVDIIGLDVLTDIPAWLRSVAPRITAEPPQTRGSTAPVLFAPNVASPELCRALIDHFEASAHEAGVMASFGDQGAYAKLDESKKKRRDTELTNASPLHGEVMKILANRLVPEIKRVFQSDMVFVDRILIARYDDTGGFFKRHRDNAAPHTAFRDFAISLNLNTHEYEGGELMFPEFDDHRYNPPAGGALVFSAALMHEALPVTRGSRYVLLTFLGGTEAQAKLTAWTESQAAKAAAS